MIEEAGHCERKMEIRWAILAVVASRPRLLGKYCFSFSKSGDPKIRTFRTRAKARDAKKACGFKGARVVKVRLMVEVV